MTIDTSPRLTQANPLARRELMKLTGAGAVMLAAGALFTPSNTEAQTMEVQTMEAQTMTNDWDKVFPKQLIDISSKDGKIWAVPVNIHRSNVLWYNKKVLADNGIVIGGPIAAINDGPCGVRRIRPRATSQRPKGCCINHAVQSCVASPELCPAPMAMRMAVKATPA